MINLDVHSIYSTKRSILKLDQIINFAKENGHKASALTDDDGLYGAIYFYKQCKAANIKPIIGTELNICEDISIKDRSNLKISLIAKNRDGYSNLCRLITRANTEGFYYVPRIDWKILKQHSKDLICLLSGERNLITEPFLEGQIDYASLNLNRIAGIFLDQFHIIINPFSSKPYHEYIKWIMDLEPLNLAVSNRARFLKEEQFEFYDLLRCSERNEEINNPKRTKFNDEEFLQTKEEIIECLSETIIEDDIHYFLEESEKIADKIDISFEKKIHFPHINIGSHSTIESYFKNLLNKKWKEKLHLLKYDTIENYKKRIKYETDVILKLGYSEYFVIVADIVDFAREKDIPVGDGRGSAAGCLVSYILGITKVDPLRYNLIFERFLDPTGIRVTPPDIDIDFCDTGRSEIVQYIINKWGSDKVAVVGNLSTLAFKSSIKDAAKALGISFEQANNYTKYIPFFVHSLEEAKKLNHIRKQLRDDNTFNKLLYLADGIKGSMKTLSTHAAGVVIAPEEITKFTPLQKTKDTGTNVLTTQLDKDEIEILGLLKIDVLGLTALRTIQNTLRLIESKYGEKIDLDEVDLDDNKIYNLIQKGHTMGIFQLESPGMTELGQQLKTSSVEEICALIALYRPAVLESNLHEMYIYNKFNKDKKSIHPLINKATEETYNVLVYQEQMMRATVLMAGFSFAEADILRRAMAKKKEDDIPVLKKKFIEGCIKNNIPDKEAIEVFAIFENASYAFNKSHSLSYARTSAKTAWLKTYYPTEYMCAYLNSESGDFEKIKKIIDECISYLNIEILPPDINNSFDDFSIEYGSKKSDKNKIRYGFSVIKSIGNNSLDDIINIRKNIGQFNSIEHFVETIDSSQLSLLLNKIEILIKLGTFDSLNSNRKFVLNKYLTLMSIYKDIGKKGRAKSSLLNLNNLAKETKIDRDFSRNDKYNFELEHLGISFS